MSSGPDTPTFPPNPTPFGFGFTNLDEKMELGKASNVESVKDEIEDEIEDFTPSQDRPTSISECREIQGEMWGLSVASIWNTVVWLILLNFSVKIVTATAQSFLKECQEDELKKLSNDSYAENSLPAKSN